jgi:putative redox protein
MEVVVAGGVTGLTQEILVGVHPLTADEPVSEGGADAGPSPYEFLLAALGSCTSMTIGMYARRKSWPLIGITVRLRHSKVHARDCADCDADESRLDRIERDIQLQGKLSAEQREKLLEIADKCPVHRTLTSKIEILTRLV